MNTGPRLACVGIEALAWLLAVVVVLLPGCGSRGDRGSAGTADSRQDTIIFATPADATTLDPHNTTDTESDQVILMLYDNLIAFDDHMNIVGELAERWGVADDGVTWTFHLRDGVRFHDGTVLDAEAVRQNFARVLDPGAGHKRYPLFTMIDRVEATDARTVRFITKYPFGAFEATMAHDSAAIINPVVADRYGRRFGTTAEAVSGSGPYRVVSWKKDLEIAIERNDDYWGAAGETRRIIYRPIPEASSRVIALEAGDVDLITRLPARDIARLEQRPTVAVTKVISVGAQQFRFNCAKKPLSDPRVRQAISYAVDRRAIVENLMPGLAVPSVGPLTPIMRGHAALGEIPYDPERSRRLLREAGYPRGFKTTISTTPRYVMGVELAEAMAAQLRHVGIEATIQVYDWATMVQFWAGLTPDRNPQEIFIMGAGASTADADWGLRPIFRTAPTNENNYGYYSNAEFDRVIEEAMRETNPERRQALYRRAQEIVYLEDPGAVWLFDIYFVVASRRTISGLRPSPLGVVTLEHAVASP